MVLYALIALILGIALGFSGFQPDWLLFVTSNTTAVLYILMLLVGISVGFHKGLIKQLKSNPGLLVIVPTATIVATLGAGFVLSLFTGIPSGISTAITSGLGWYSLSGITLTTLVSADIGTITFLSNLLREMLSFFSIPLISKYLNYPTAIAPAAATSEDTTLAMLIRYTDEHTAMIAVFNGIVCSAAVPILIPFCLKFF